MALHSGASVVTQYSDALPNGDQKLATPNAFWHIGGATLTYEPFVSLWMYRFPNPPHTFPATRVNRWFRRDLSYDGFTSVARRKQARSNTTLLSDGGTARLPTGFRQYSSPGPDADGLSPFPPCNASDCLLSPRQFHSAVLLGGTQMLVFGGRISMTSGQYVMTDDLFLVDMTHDAVHTLNEESSVRFQMVPKLSAWPSRRACHAHAALPLLPNGSGTPSVVISGGVTFECGTNCNCTGGVLDDVWLFDSTRFKWSMLPTLPLKLYGHAMASIMVQHRRLLYVFGGGVDAELDQCNANGRGSPWINPLSVSGKVFTLDVTDPTDHTQRWSELDGLSSGSASPGFPGPRFFVSATVSNNKFVFYGGATCPPDYLTENGTMCIRSVTPDFTTVAPPGGGGDHAAAAAANQRSVRGRQGPMSFSSSATGGTEFLADDDVQPAVPTINSLGLYTKNDTWYFQPYSPTTGSWNLVQPEQGTTPWRIGSTAALYESTAPTGLKSARLLLYGGVDFQSITEATGSTNIKFGLEVPPLAALTLGCNNGSASGVGGFLTQSCMPCPQGTFSLQGQQNCTACGEGTSSKAGAASVGGCNTCVDGWCANFGTCSAANGVPSCDCIYMFDDGKRCKGMRNAMLVFLLLLIFAVGVGVLVYCRKTKRRLRRQSHRVNYYEDVIQEKDEELVRQIFEVAECCVLRLLPLPCLSPSTTPACTRTTRTYSDSITGIMCANWIAASPAICGMFVVRCPPA